jgi:acylpyruvate hydrolase
MKIALLEHHHTPRIAIADGDRYVWLDALCPSLPHSLPELLMQGSSVRAMIEKQLPLATAWMRIAASEARFLPPLARHNKVICVGLNYADHAAEGKQEIPEYPVFFLRMPSSFVGHGQAMIRPKASEKLDYEAELAVVIGKQCRHVSADKAAEVIAGYTLCNDGSVRDYQKRVSQWTLGKNFDASGALGPEIVTPDALPAFASGLKIESFLNGERLQHATTDQMLFAIPTLIAALTEVMTLEAGDIISTGTPAGVGFARTPKLWLKAGDTIEVQVEGVGTLTNRVLAEA